MTRRGWLGLLGGGLLGFPGVAFARPAADFESLFDGESLAGWTAIGAAPGAWRVDGGTLATGPNPGKNWLSTNRPYADFGLRLDYCLGRGGNSGVLLRAPHRGDPSFAGIEVQLLDDDAPSHRDLKPAQYSGSVYGVIPARRGATRPAGEWNRLAIRLEGFQIAVDLNGVRVVDARLDGHAWAAERHPGLARTTGFIGLQAHETPVRFRNIALRPIA